MKRLKKFFGMSKHIKLDSLRFGVAGGIVSALCISLSTIIGVLGGYRLHGMMMNEMYGMLGYSIGWSGVFIGALYGFIDGFFLAWVFAVIYNWLIR
jgi:hypothetical protein